MLGVRATHKIKAGAAGCDPCFMLFKTVKSKEQVTDVITERNGAPLRPPALIRFPEVLTFLSLQVPFVLLCGWYH